MVLLTDVRTVPTSTNNLYFEQKREHITMCLSDSHKNDSILLRRIHARCDEKYNIIVCQLMSLFDFFLLHPLRHKSTHDGASFLWSSLLKVVYVSYLNLVLRKPVFGVFEQVRYKPGCTATEDG